jgi:host factor-I protein
MDPVIRKNILQEVLLPILRKDRIPVYIYLVNGIKLHGVILAFEAEAIFLSRDDAVQCILQHAISTIHIQA